MILQSMVLCIDIALFGHREIPGIRVETGYRVTANGVVPFSPSMEKLLRSCVR